MPHLTKEEHTAALRAGARAGEYLDEIGESDMAKLTLEQWEQFISCIILNFYEIANDRS